MNATRPFRKAIGLLLVAALPPTRAPAGADQSTEITAVSSKVSEGYVRAKRPDGSFKPETYAFGDGGHMNGPERDDSIDHLDFMSVARTIAVPLASQNYLPADEPKDTNLLIMVYWGTTNGSAGAGGAGSLEHQLLQDSQVSSMSAPTAAQGAGSSGPAGASARSAAQASGIMKQVATDNYYSLLATVALEDRQRAEADLRNANLLGYDSELANTEGLGGTALRHGREDLISEIEDNRYFVVLMAYDFPLALKEKKAKLLWVTRISIRQKGNDFGRALPAMARVASQYFGKDSHGLLRKPIPEGRVEVGEPRSLGVVPEK